MSVQPTTAGLLTDMDHTARAWVTAERGWAMGIVSSRETSYAHEAYLVARDALGAALEDDAAGGAS